MKETEETPLNSNWERVGKLTLWLFKTYANNLPTAEMTVYQYIAHNSVAYGFYDTKHMSISAIADNISISRRTIQRVLTTLIEKELIIRMVVNREAFVGKLPYKYMLNIKLPNFPHLGNLIMRDKQVTQVNLPTTAAKPKNLLEQFNVLLRDYDTKGKFMTSSEKVSSIVTMYPELQAIAIDEGFS